MAVDLQGNILDQYGNKTGTINPVSQTPDAIKAYQDAGGTLTNGQIPTISAPTGQDFTTTPINSSVLSSTSNNNYIVPSSTSPASFPTAPTPSLAPTPQEQGISDLIKGLTTGPSLESQKLQYTTQQENAQNLPALQQAEQDLTAQYNQLAADYKAIQPQTEAQMVGRASIGAISGETGARQREVAVQALGVSALLSAAQGKVAFAQSQVDRAVNAKFGPLEAERNAKIQNLQLLLQDPALTIAQQNRAQAQLDYQNAQKEKEAQQKADFQTIQGIALTASQNLQNFVPSAQFSTASLALKAIQSAKDPVTAQMIASQVFPTPVGGKEGFTLSEGQTRYDAKGNIVAKNSPAVSNIATSEIDSTSQSILAQTGLSGNAFFWLTGRASQLPRDQATRNAAAAEATKWANEHGVDLSTLPAQYDAYNKVLAFNTTRQSMATVQENEIQATINNLSAVAPSGDLGKLNFANVAKIWAGQQVNDPTAQQYAFHLEQLRNEIVAYNLIAQGQINSDGSLKQADTTDIQRATDVIKGGVSSGSLAGLSTAVSNSTAKMRPVLQQSLDAARQAVWTLFGVGGNFKTTDGTPTGTIVTAPDGTQVEITD